MVQRHNFESQQSAACLQLHPYAFKSSITGRAGIRQSDRVLKYEFWSCVFLLQIVMNIIGGLQWAKTNWAFLKLSDSGGIHLLRKFEKRVDCFIIFPPFYGPKLGSSCSFCKAESHPAEEWIWVLSLSQRIISSCEGTRMAVISRVLCSTKALDWKSTFMKAPHIKRLQWWDLWRNAPHTPQCNLIKVGQFKRASSWLPTFTHHHLISSWRPVWSPREALRIAGRKPSNP